jgi:protein TonB
MEERIPDYGRSKDTTLVVVGVAVSLGLHGALVGAVWLNMLFAPEKKKEEPPDMKFEKVELLALGEKKPKTRLPRKANPEPAPETKKDEINIAKKEEPKPEPKPEPKDKEKKPEKKEKPDKPEVKDKREPKKEPAEEPSTRDENEQRDKRRKKLLEKTASLHNPNRPTNEDTPEGSPQGIAGGSLSDAAVDNLLGTFQAKVMRRVSREWSIPSTISRSKVKKLEGEVVVYVELSSSGHIKSYRFKKKSSNDQFNSSIDRVLKKFTQRWGSKKIPLPEKQQIRRLVLKEGLNLKEWEYTGH